ncbi:MAG: ABC transporter permease, partial [Actinobacteria bacterium]|nr:ABC transporter permease [Actinomycetota bacterium]
YPWPGLTRLQWFQDVTLANPLTYVSEGMRAALTHLPHLGSGWIALGIVGAVAFFTGLGVRGFVGRALD